MIICLTKILSTLGPGLLYTDAAIDVSHLVMSTKAGASYQYVFLLLIPLIHLPAIMTLLAAAIILYIGQYTVLNKVMKVVVIILTLITITTLTMVLLMTPGGIYSDVSPIFSFYECADIIFLAAFLGWMPALMDVSVWHSVWSKKANRNNETRVSLRKAILDFRVEFFGTALLAMAFLSLSALIMFGSDEPPSAIGSVFAGQLTLCIRIRWVVGHTR